MSVNLHETSVNLQWPHHMWMRLDVSGRIWKCASCGVTVSVLMAGPAGLFGRRVMETCDEQVAAEVMGS